jgi:hypothetical protein
MIVVDRATTLQKTSRYRQVTCLHRASAESGIAVDRQVSSLLRVHAASCDIAFRPAQYSSADDKQDSAAHRANAQSPHALKR